MAEGPRRIPPKKFGGGGTDWTHRKRGRFGGLFRNYYIGRTDPLRGDRREMECEIPPTTEGGATPPSIAHWDIAPPAGYFDELARVSKNQIIWGGNYFDLPPTRCFIVWDKKMSENFSMAMCEYAWTSFGLNAKIFRAAPNGPAQGETRIHPTQKPVALYTWLLARYAKPGYKILDTHVGSASSLIACRRAGLPYVGFEIDPVYYRMACERLERELAQVNITDLL